jgi:tetratricopeptide (TPR) repeat protein
MLRRLIGFILVFGLPGIAQNLDCDSWQKCQDALISNKDSALIHYRNGEILFTTKQFQMSANEFRRALSLKITPKWIEVWAHVYLGEIFDLTDQRERALNEYRLAILTNDDTRGAQAEAKRYQAKPYGSDSRTRP